MNGKPKVRTCLWFDGNGDEAANFYVSLLPASFIQTPASCFWPPPSIVGNIPPYLGCHTLILSNLSLCSGTPTRNPANIQFSFSYGSLT